MVGARGYYPADTPVEKYDPGFIRESSWGVAESICDDKGNEGKRRDTVQLGG